MIASIRPPYIQPSYILATAGEDEERLTILNELHNPSSLSALKIESGLHVLTLGCGIGLLELEMAKLAAPSGHILGTDISQKHVAIAQQNAARACNLEFRSLDALQIDQVPGLFDRIHSRYLLTHLPWEKIVQILPMLYAKLAPGGFILLEEVASLDSLSCAPSHKGYEKWKLTAIKQFSLQNSDLSPGKKILQHICEQGWKATSTSYQQILSTPREKSILTLGVLSARSRLLNANLYTASEIEEMVKQLRDLEQNPHVTPRYNEVIQIKIFK
ncbi:MAG: class I SAM-dependent methyltransferase [Parachlamydia sp.]|nr:class I SAM-dependent methyltransferase [Parachlamydia sp.]